MTRSHVQFSGQRAAKAEEAAGGGSRSQVPRSLLLLMLPVSHLEMEKKLLHQEGGISKFCQPFDTSSFVEDGKVLEQKRVILRSGVQSKKDWLLVSRKKGRN